VLPDRHSRSRHGSRFARGGVARALSRLLAGKRGQFRCRRIRRGALLAAGLRWMLFPGLARVRQRARGLGDGQIALALGGDDGNRSWFAAGRAGIGVQFSHDGTSVYLLFLATMPSARLRQAFKISVSFSA
jgi:hypothetical protein